MQQSGADLHIHVNIMKLIYLSHDRSHSSTINVNDGMSTNCLTHRLRLRIIVRFGVFLRESTLWGTPYKVDSLQAPFPYQALGHHYWLSADPPGHR
jgi:hypothetical protein